MRAAEEIPRQVAEASARVVRSSFDETRRVLRWLVVGMVLMAMLALGATFLAWRSMFF
jgi:hypothetical protein